MTQQSKYMSRTSARRILTQFYWSKSSVDNALSEAQKNGEYELGLSVIVRYLYFEDKYSIEFKGRFDHL